MYERLEAAGARLEAGLAPFGRVQRVGAMLTLFMRRRAGARFDEAQACDTERYGALFRHLLEQGVYVAPSQFEAMFVSTAHGDAEIERTVEAVADFFGLIVWDGDRRRGRGREPALGRGAACRSDRELVAVFSPLLAEERYAARRSRRSTRATCSTTGGRACSRRRRGTRRSCSATTSTRTGSSASPRTRTSTRSPTSPR